MAGKEVKVESYAGYKEGETPRKIFLGGREYPVEYIVYRYRQFDLETEDYADVFKMMLKDYGECDIFYRHNLDCWELKDKKPPEKSFADEFMEKKSSDADKRG